MSEKMAPLTIDLEKLLAPISVERPAGESLRYEGTYDRIQEARREDDPTLEQGIWKTKLKKADWPAVRDICLEALETRSKDVQMAVWLLEAWLHLHGFSGVREGFKLLVGLCEGFWDELYPELHEDDVEYRIAPLVWMNEKLSVKLKTIPITHPQTADVLTYTWADWENASHLENLARKDSKLLQSADVAGKATVTKVQGSVMLSPKSFYVSLAQELSSTMDAIAVFERLLEDRIGNRAPSMVQFKDVLQDVQRLVHDILLERAEEASEDEIAVLEEEQEGPIAALEEEGGLISRGGPIRSRAEAYRRLLEAAEYLLRAEPHSPTPYLVKRAVSWGSMTLMDLLQEIVNDERDRDAIFRLLGIKKGGGG